ncbi:SRPBCC family protein [Polluticoccus soli]|uniref:SRPBCC family protein n=1 Tax=Polluticoccus soli TaxID=3034150 RepID=UPI0023E302EB|nr:SRPBCC domain-containing protein [Flavipsychrobacter sp. JY13-12]
MPINISAITINATKEKVWDALTKPELVKLWQFDSDLTTDWQVDSDIRFTTRLDGTVMEQWGRVLDIRPLELLRYSLFAPGPDIEDKPENYFIMSYILTDDEGNTNLEIRQEDNRPGAVQEEPQGEENPVLQLLKKVVESN